MNTSRTSKYRPFEERDFSKGIFKERNFSKESILASDIIETGIEFLNDFLQEIRESLERENQSKFPNELPLKTIERYLANILWEIEMFLDQTENIHLENFLPKLWSVTVEAMTEKMISELSSKLSPSIEDINKARAAAIILNRLQDWRIVWIFYEEKFREFLSTHKIIRDDLDPKLVDGYEMESLGEDILPFAEQMKRIPSYLE